MSFFECYAVFFGIAFVFAVIWMLFGDHSSAIPAPELPYTKLMKLPFVKINRIQVGQSRRGFVKYYRAQIQVTIPRRTVDGVSQPEVTRRFMCDEDSEHSGFDPAPRRTVQSTEALEFVSKYYDAENERFIG